MISFQTTILCLTGSDCLLHSEGKRSTQREGRKQIFTVAVNQRQREGRSLRTRKS